MSKKVFIAEQETLLEVQEQVEKLVRNLVPDDAPIYGMLAKAVVVTDDSTYLRREFTDGRELVMFRRQELGTLPERVFDLFGHLERAQEIADCGYAAARDGHTWKSRAEYLKECFLT